MTNLAYFSFFYLFYQNSLSLKNPNLPAPSPLHFRDGMKTIRRRGGASAYPLACLLAMLGGGKRKKEGERGGGGEKGRKD